MDIHRILFFNDSFENPLSSLAELHQLTSEYPQTLTYQSSVIPSDVADFNLIVIEAEVETMDDALETCRRLRSKSDKPILFLAPLADEESALEVYNAGADEYIVRPVNPELLYAKLAAWQRWSIAKKGLA